MRTICDVAPTGARSSASADAMVRLIQVLAPSERKWVDRGSHSLVGKYRDWRRGKYRRAKSLDCGGKESGPDGEEIWTG